MSFDAFLAEVRERTEAALDALLPPPDETPLPAAMRHAALGGGKRLRAALVQAAGRACGGVPEALDAPAAAVELLHAYSLVHDDLPAMDDASVRRGLPACHVAYGEATAILAGDALQALAFQALAQAGGVPPQARARMVATLAEAAGCAGMAGGQMRDLTLDRVQGADQALLERVSRGKTGALMRASVALGALATGAEAHVLRALDAYADALGLAFQVRDDVLDVAGSPGRTGKAAGIDDRNRKATFASVLGVDGAQAYAEALCARAAEALAALPERGHLAELARLAVGRDR